MEPAATLKKNKTSINKGKLKKTIKNILCRPDPQSWPIVPDDDTKLIKSELQKHRVVFPEFKKSHWEKLKHLPKDERPKPPKLQNVKGLLFGLTTCSNAVQKRDCSAIILESTLNPRVIAHLVTEACVSNEVPYVCMPNLRSFCGTNFGIPTICLGIQSNFFPELSKMVVDIARKLGACNVSKNTNSSTFSISSSKPDVKITEVAKSVEEGEPSITSLKSAECPYLYRTNKKNRIFVPDQQTKVPTQYINQFVGQDFIELGKVPRAKNKHLNNMIVKRITNNPNRKSGKSKRKK